MKSATPGPDPQRIAKHTAVLKSKLPIRDDQNVEDACPRPEGTHGAPQAKPGIAVSERQAHHGGHLIKVVTTYEITIDGKPLERHLGVNREGKVHCHALPYGHYDSTIDLVKDFIDAYPDRFAGRTGHDHGES